MGNVLLLDTFCFFLEHLMPPRLDLRLSFTVGCSIFVAWHTHTAIILKDNLVSIIWQVWENVSALLPAWYGWSILSLVVKLGSLPIWSQTEQGAHGRSACILGTFLGRWWWRIILPFLIKSFSKTCFHSAGSFWISTSSFTTCIWGSLLNFAILLCYPHNSCRVQIEAIELVHHHWKEDMNRSKMLSMLMRLGSLS